MPDTDLATVRQTVGERAADEHGLRAQRQRLDDVRAAADAGVEQHLDLLADGVGDLRQHLQRPDRAVHLPSAVVGHDDALHARQAAWKAEQSASFQDYLRRKDPAAVVNGDWPVIAR